MTDSSSVRLTFCETSVFTRQITGLLLDDELNALQWVLMAQPDRGDLIRGSGGLRKIRWAGSGRGKRGGLRVILLLARPRQHHPLPPCLSEERAGRPYARSTQSCPIHHPHRI